MTKHNIIFLDFETYYDGAYSLRSMTPAEYILDRRFEVICCAVKVNNQPSEVIDGPDLPVWLASYPPESTTTVTYNALFDNCILAWQYGYVPQRMVCAMRMAVALRGHRLQSYSLGAVADLLGLGCKGSFIQNMKGMTRRDIRSNPTGWTNLCKYARQDVDLCAAIFDKLLPEFPSSELRVMDRVLRCAVEPKFMIDETLLRQHLNDLEQIKKETLEAAFNGQWLEHMSVDACEAQLRSAEAQLRSTSKFEKLLQDRGVEIEYKPSPTDPTRQVPCFAKTDQFMQDLLNHDDPAIQTLATARMGVRSTIERTRGERMLKIARLNWQSYRDGSPRLYSGGTMPMPLRYAGAHTHRLSGDWKMNPQNFPAGRGGQTSTLRKALLAPPGHKVVVADKSQIECRLNAWFCGQDNLLDDFKCGGDPYSTLATRVFGYPVNKNDHPVERFIGKTGVLGLGYGCGVDKFYNMVIRSAQTLGFISDIKGIWTKDLALKTVDTYRLSNRKICLMWASLQTAMEMNLTGKFNPAKFDAVEIGHSYVKGPLGLRMNYNVMPPDPDGQFRYSYGGKVHKLYGAKFLENIIQFLARINLMHDALRISDRGFRFVLQAHDELVFIVPDEQIEECKQVVIEEMTRPPSWAPDLPLAAEVGVGSSYGDAK